ncbi:cold-shock protein [Sinirhodobacter ferrireducens]|uniref:Cold-shock protein n=1 Tax=Paenirhodobacter ferrireducens TaxID=1215032 RepID=A0A443LEJ6_9RHOB|nr:cold-shock protein [Sinirhodobacter ferrireducens]
MANDIVKWSNATKGFGLVEPKTGGGDIFVHISAPERAGRAAQWRAGTGRPSPAKSKPAAAPKLLRSPAWRSRAADRRKRPSIEIPGGSLRDVPEGRTWLPKRSRRARPTGRERCPTWKTAPALAGMSSS